MKLKSKFCLGTTLPASITITCAITLSLLGNHSAQAATGTWTGTTSGNWSDTTKWTGGTIADGVGFTAGFNNTTGTVTATLDTPRTLGHIVGNNTVPGTAANWTISSATNALTFNNGGSNSQIANGANAVAPLTVDTDIVLLSNLLVSANGNNNSTITFGSAVGGHTITGAKNITISSTSSFGNGTITFNDNISTTGAISNVSTGTANPGAVLIKGVIGGGVTGVTQNGTGMLTLSGANLYSGGTTISSNTLSISADNNLGSSAGVISFTGGTLDLTASITTMARQINLTSGTGTIRLGASVVLTNTGIVTGSGNLLFTQTGSGGRTVNLNSLSNNFTGSIGVDLAASGQSLNLNIASIADGAGNLRFGQGTVSTTFTYTGVGAASLATRGVELFGAGTHAVSLTSSAAGINLGGNLSVTGTGAKTLTLDGPAGVISTWGGTISNGSGTVTITKAGSGTWGISGNMSHTGGLNIGALGLLNLSGTNTYSGATVNTFANPIGSGLVIRGMQALSPNSSITATHVGGSGGFALIKLLDDSATPASRSTVNYTFSNSNASQNTISLFVGNNSIANGGTSASTQTGSTIQIGNYNATQGAVGNTAGQGLIVTGANGYKLQIANLNVSLQAAYATVYPLLLQADASVIVGGNVQQAAGSGGTTTLTLQGSATGSQVNGNILNSLDATPKALALTKSNPGTWTLSGTNSYSGATSITGGKLVFSGAASMSATSTIGLGAPGHLSLGDTTAQSFTIPALTMTSLANLTFDWTGTSTGDQLTSTAAINPTAGSLFAVNLNITNAPTGTLTLLTGGATSTLSGSKFYLANSTNYTAALTVGATTVTVGSYASVAPLTAFYWTGNKLAGTATAGIDNALALSDGTNSNWSSTTTAYTSTGGLTPGATANLIFANGQVGKTQQSTTLGADMTVNSVTFDDSIAVTVAGGSSNFSTLTLMSTSGTAGTVAAPGSAISVTTNSNAATTINSRVALGANQTWNVFSGKTLTVNGVVDGPFSLTKADSGSLILSGTNTYTGDTTISGGVLTIGNGTTGTLGSGNYAGNISIATGSILNVWSTASETFSGVISGGGNITTAYGGTVTLTGNNTYTGKTSLTPQTTAGSTLSVSSFNSVSTNVGLGTVHSASSSLGSPVTVANGTIVIGDTGKQASCNLVFTGGNETTDRVLQINLNGSDSQTITTNNVGGLLKFTSSFLTSGNTSSTSALVLSGTGAAEIAGTIPVMSNNSTGISKSGTGTWTLSGTNAYTGTTTISTGTLATTTAVQGFGTNLSGISIGGSGTLNLKNDATTSFTNGTSPYNIANSAASATINVDRVSGTGANVITVGNLPTTSTAVTWDLKFTGATGVSLNAGALTTPTAAAGSHTITNNIVGGGSLTLASVAGGGTGAAATLLFGGTGNTTITGAITQVATAQALTKSGTGTLTLNGASSYSGVTSIPDNSGIISVRNSGGLGTSNVTIGSVLGNAVTGTLRLSNNIAITGTATLNAPQSRTAISGGGAAHIENFADNNSLSANLTIGGPGGAGINILSTAGILTLSGSLKNANGAGRQFIFSGAGTTIVSGIIADTTAVTTTTALTIAGPGITTLTNANTYTAATIISGGTLQIGSGLTTGSLTATTSITDNGNLTINRSNPFSQATDLGAGVAITGTGSFTQAGAGITTLTATANAYTGTTTVTLGTLALGANNVLPDASNVSVASATLDAATFTDTAGTLNATGTAIINLGAGSALAFANSSAVTWVGSVNITGSFVSGSSMRFGTTNAGLTSTQLALVSVNGSGAGTYTLDASGYLISSGPGPVDHFTISSISSPQTVGTPITGITLTAQDASNATATSFTGTVTFGGTGGFTGTSASFTAGVLNGVSVTPTVAGSNLTFTVNDGASHTGTTTIATIQTQYTAWSGGAAFDADTNGDGVKNGLAFLLGAANKDVNALALVPVPTQDAGKLVMTFDCLSSANRGSAVLNLQYSKDLGIADLWTNHEAAVPGTAPTSTTVNTANFTTTANGALIHVVAEVPASAASPGSALFGRLNATTP